MKLFRNKFESDFFLHQVVPGNATQLRNRKNKIKCTVRKTKKSINAHRIGIMKHHTYGNPYKNMPFMISTLNRIYDKSIFGLDYEVQSTPPFNNCWNLFIFPIDSNSVNIFSNRVTLEWY